MSVQIAINENTASITFGYDPEIVTAVKTIPGRRFDPATKAWTVALDNPAAVTGLRHFAEAQGVALELDEAEALTLVIPDVSTVDIAGTASSTLRPHQAAFVAAVQGGARALLLADEPGMGKSAGALIAARAAGAQRTIIVSPAVMKRTWKGEVAKFISAEAKSVILSGRKPDASALGDAEFVIVNYDVVQYWAEVLTVWAPEALIVDEAHYAKNYKSLRTKGVLALAKHIRKENGLVIALTGTPIPNKVIDIYAVLDALGVSGAFGSWWDFAARYAGAYKGGYGVEYGTPKHLDELHARLTETVLVRRRKDEVLDLPSRTVADIPLDLDATGTRSVKAATKALVDAISKAVKREQEKDDSATTVTRAFVRKVVAKALRPGSTGDAASALASLRRTIGIAKISLIAQQARDLAEQGESVVVMVHHRDVQQGVAEALSDFRPGIITGAQSEDDRQEAIEAFQAGRTKVIVCSTKAAGVGITLHAASNLVLGELPWTAADQDQAIDRIHRIGQDSPVTAWRMLATGTLDDRMASLIEQKGEWSNQAIDGGVQVDGAKALTQAQVLTDLVREALKIK